MYCTYIMKQTHVMSLYLVQEAKAKVVDSLCLPLWEGRVEGDG